MKYWLMAHVVHVADFPYWLMHASEWTIYLNSHDEKLNEGDIVYIANQEQGIFAWGSIWEKNAPELNEPFIKVGRGAIKQSLVSPEQIKQVDDLAELISFPDGKFTFLTNKQVKILNSLLPSQISKPPMPRKRQFVFDQPVENDEDLSTEFKEVKPKNISNEAYEFAISFLNQKGGSIYFGIRDKDKKVIGLTLNNIQRDEIKKSLENKLSGVKPRIDANKNYFVDFHNIIDSKGNEIAELYIFEVEIKPSVGIEYKSSSGKTYLKTYSGRKIVKD